MMRAMTCVVGQSRQDRRRRQKLDRKHVVGLPQLRFVEELLGPLRAACDHPNRKLFFDDLVIALLLAFFNPVVRSLRGIEDASQMPGINQHLDIEAIKRSTAGDALASFDPQLLVPLIAHLRERVMPREIDATDPTLRGMLNRLLAYDGSYFRTAADVGWALRERHGKNAKLRGRVRLNLHLSVRDGLPTGASFAGRDDPGEPTALLEDLQPGQIVVADRGCFSHQTVHQLLKGKVDLVLRLQQGVRCDVIAQRVVSQEDRDAGVISDQTVMLAGCKNQHPHVPLRLVTIQPSPEQGDSSRDASTADKPPSPIRLLTSIQDDTVSAWMIGHLYRRRWDIELFFRWLKSCAQWDHLLSESRNGMLMQMYVALIGTLLLSISTGRKPDRYSFQMLCLAAAGHGSIEDALAILARRHAERDRDRQRRKQRQQNQTK
jgi:hypothetical protein